MKKTILFLFLCLLLLFAVCKKSETTETVFRKAEKLESSILKNINDIAQCKADYEKILLDAPESKYAPLACYKLGKLNEIFGHYEEAVDYYRKLVSLYPEHAIGGDGLFNMAQIYQLHLNQPDKAIITYNQFINFYPEHKAALRAFIQLGQIYSEKEDWKSSLSIYQQIVHKYSENKICDDLYFRMADILQFKLADTSRAMKLYQHLIENYPNSSWVAHAEQRLSQLKQGGNKNEK